MAPLPIKSPRTFCRIASTKLLLSRYHIQKGEYTMPPIRFPTLICSKIPIKLLNGGIIVTRSKVAKLNVYRWTLLKYEMRHASKAISGTKDQIQLSAREIVVEDEKLPS